MVGCPQGGRGLRREYSLRHVCLFLPHIPSTHVVAAIGVWPRGVVPRRVLWVGGQWESIHKCCLSASLRHHPWLTTAIECTYDVNKCA